MRKSQRDASRRRSLWRQRKRGPSPADIFVLTSLRRRYKHLKRRRGKKAAKEEIQAVVYRMHRKIAGFLLGDLFK